MIAPFDLKNHLHSSLDSLFSVWINTENREGLFKLIYKDEHDRFDLTLVKTNMGFQVGGALNNSTSYQLNGRFFPPATEIGQVMLIAAGAPNTTIDRFFNS